MTRFDDVKDKSVCITLAAPDSSARSQKISDVICGTDDFDKWLTEAIDALPTNGGIIQLTDGTFGYNSTPTFTKNNVTIRGFGNGIYGVSTPATTLTPLSTMTYSLNVNGAYNTVLEDFGISAGSLATMPLVAAPYNKIRRISSWGHTTYNMRLTYATEMMEGCSFYGKPVAVSAYVGNIIGNYFNGGGADPCLYVGIAGAVTGNWNIIGNSFESYAGGAITSSFAGNIYNINIIGNYFESAFTNTNLINFTTPSSSLSSTISGNYQSTDALCTNSVNILTAYGVSILPSNYFTHTINIGSASILADVENGYAGSISYNSQTGLDWLKIHRQTGVLSYSEMPGTAAPTGGTWRVGDSVINKVPSAGGAPGWLCTAAGTPGTWKARASIAS